MAAQRAKLAPASDGSTPGRRCPPGTWPSRPRRDRRHSGRRNERPCHDTDVAVHCRNILEHTTSPIDLRRVQPCWCFEVRFCMTDCKPISTGSGGNPFRLPRKASSSSQSALRGARIDASCGAQAVDSFRPQSSLPGWCGATASPLCRQRRHELETSDCRCEQPRGQRRSFPHDAPSMPLIRQPRDLGQVGRPA